MLTLQLMRQTIMIRRLTSILSTQTILFPTYFKRCTVGSFPLAEINHFNQRTSVKRPQFSRQKSTSKDQRSLTLLMGVALFFNRGSNHAYCVDAIMIDLMTYEHAAYRVLWIVAHTSDLSDWIQACAHSMDWKGPAQILRQCVR